MSSKGIPTPVWIIGGIVAACTILGPRFGTWVGKEATHAATQTGKATVAAAAESAGDVCQGNNAYACAAVPLNPAGDAANLAGVYARTVRPYASSAGGPTVTAAPSSSWSTVPPRPSAGGGSTSSGTVPPRPTTAWTTPPRSLPAAPPVTAPPGPPTPAPPVTAPPPAVPAAPKPEPDLPQIDGSGGSGGIVGELPEVAQEGLRALTAGVG